MTRIEDSQSSKKKLAQEQQSSICSATATRDTLETYAFDQHAVLVCLFVWSDVLKEVEMICELSSRNEKIRFTF